MANGHGDKTGIITGANGGLGLETCKILIQDGFTNLTLACRTEAKAQQAREALLATSASPEGLTLTAVGGFDMTDPISIEQAVASLPEGMAYDVVFLQSGGVIVGSDYQTVDFAGISYEKTVFQNVLGGHVTLAHLQQRGLIAKGARVVVAGGEGARGLPPLIERPEFESATSLRQYVTANFSNAKSYNAFNGIGVSKFMSALWVQKLAELEADNFSTIWFSLGFSNVSLREAFWAIANDVEPWRVAVAL